MMKASVITLLYGLSVALISVVGGSTAAAQSQGSQVVLSSGHVDFGQGQDTQSQSIKVINNGDSSAKIVQVTIIEEGFNERRRHNNKATPVFSITKNIPKTINAGETSDIVVQFSQPQGHSSQQFFGAVQLKIIDEDASDPYFISFGLQSGGSWFERNILVLMLLAPAIGLLLLFAVPKQRDVLCRYVTLGASGLVFVLAIALYAMFDPQLGVGQGNWGLQFVTHTSWIRALNIEFFLGVDGLSILMVLLTAFISFIACISSWTISKHIRGYMMMILLVEIGMLGTFVALDFFLFYVFWEIMLIPMFFLIAIWGGEKKESAAIKFFLYGFIGSILMLVSLVALYFNSGGESLLIANQPLALIDGTPVKHTFDLMKLTYLHDFTQSPMLLGVDFTYLVWILLFGAFAIKVPIVPLHTWLPEAHVEAPTAVSVILAGVLLKMGIYGMFRLNYSILPDATQDAAIFVAMFGVINILYGAFCAFKQTDLKKLIAYSSVSHMGFCLLGMAALTNYGITGSMLQLFSHGIITAMLFLLVGVIYDRTHTREIAAFGGFATKMPWYAAFFGFAFMASLGLPGLSGFVGELLVFIGAFPVFRSFVIVAALGVVLTAVYHLWAMQRVLFGAYDSKWDSATRHDLDRRETIMLLPLAVLVLLIGFYPIVTLDLIEHSISDLLNLYSGTTSGF